MLAVERKNLCFKHPFTCVTAGPTSSGKTVLIRRILKHHRALINFKNGIIDKLKVLWAYGQWQSLYKEQIHNVEIRYVEGLPSEDEILEDKLHIVIIDDLMTELGSDKKLTNLFTKGSHHNDISVIFMSQNIFYQ
jgi:hypothetical protein